MHQPARAGASAKQFLKGEDSCRHRQVRGGVQLDLNRDELRPGIHNQIHFLAAGRYELIPAERGEQGFADPNPLLAGSALVAPYYFSYTTAAYHYGLTTQAPATVYIATLRGKTQRRVVRDRDYQLVRLPGRQFFGDVDAVVYGLRVHMADVEKTVLDSLDRPSYAGGLPEVAQALHTALDLLDLDLLVEYARRMDDYSLAARLGYLLELFGRPVTGLPASRSPVALDPARPRRGRLNARWRIVINVSPAELNLPGIG